jgi:Type I phosphodiesterase / nucleotide pyrophosphatase
MWMALAALFAGAAAVPVGAGAAAGPGHRPGAVAHVLLISVDGLHQSDVRWYVRTHPDSELARLARGGLQYTRARTPVPSDSFPGMLAQVTGGDPRTTGVYYDAEFNHALLPPGASCTPGAAPGAPVVFDESIDRNPDSIDAGQGLSGLPDGVLAMTSDPLSVTDPATFPVNPTTCRPIAPHQYLRVNTIFEVAKRHGLRTAWSDKHPAYDILQGPSGHGIDDLFTPEINSQAFRSDGTPYGGDWTKDNAATRQYDAYKVQAVLNEIAGHDHTGTGPTVGVPAIFGLNFQTISTAEKLPRSEAMIGGPPLNGGYLPGTRTPGPLLGDALDWLDGQLATIANALARRGLADSTAIVLSAKHGQSPQDPDALVRIDDGPIIDGIDSAWRTEIGDPAAPDLVAAATDDDALMMWLSDRSPRATRFVARWLTTHTATGSTYDSADPTQRGPSLTLPASGLTQVFTGAAAARYFGVAATDPRHPDVWGVVRHGVVYTGGTGKISEHGGAGPEDRHVPLIVDLPGRRWGRVVRQPVETTQIAPTIVQLLGLDPSELQAVRQQGTRSLPHAGGH